VSRKDENNCVKMYVDYYEAESVKSGSRPKEDMNEEEYQRFK